VQSYLFFYVFISLTTIVGVLFLALKNPVVGLLTCYVVKIPLCIYGMARSLNVWTWDNEGKDFIAPIFPGLWSEHRALSHAKRMTVLKLL
jgi:hypothetical protein